MLKTILKISGGLILGVLAWWLAWPNILLFLILCLLIALLIIRPKIFLRFFIGALALVLLVWLLIQTSPVQNFIIGKVATKLSKDLNTTVKIGHVDFSLFDKMNLDNTLILDQNKDTLLSAGALKLRITDWFFLQNNIELKYIGLENAIIKQQRKDSAWNYQFIINHFSSPKKSKKSSKSIVLKIQKIDLKNVVYLSNDDWIGQNTTLKVGSLLLDADNIDLNKNIMFINSVDLDKAYYKIENFDGKKPVTKRAVAKDSGMYFNPSNLRIRINTLNLTNSFFATGLKDEIPRKGFFDGQRIEVSDINGSITNFNFIKDTITANTNLSAVERSGLKVKKIQAAFKLTPQIMEFSKLYLKLNNSSINYYYAMQFKDFNTDMSNYTTNVVMKAYLRNSFVSTDDIAFFAPALSKWKEKFIVNGKFNGSVSNFNIKNLFLRSSSNTYVAGDLSVKGLPETDKMLVTLNHANVQTNSREIAFIYPGITSIKSPDLFALGNVHFVGDLNGTTHNVNAKGTLASALGGMYTDLALSFPANAEPTYKGSLETQQFNLGRFFSIPDLTNVSFKGNVEGKSFLLDKIYTKLDGKFNSLTYRDYTYSNLTFNGQIKQKNFTGDFKAEDSNFIFTSNIIVDLNGAAPSFNVLGDLVTANLKALKFTNDSVSVTGLFDLNFQGHNIDDFLGYAKILNATITHNNQQLNFDSLTVTAALDSASQKKLTVESNEFLVSVEGQYNILQLPNSFQSFLNHYYPSYINPPKTVLANQNFTASIKTGDFDNYARLVDSNLSGFNNAFLSGKISTASGNKFDLEVDIPTATYKKYTLEQAKFTGNGDDDSLLLTGNVGRFYLSDSSYFPNTKITIQSASDLSHVKISTRANATLNDAELDADVRTLPDGVKINFHPSSFVLNDKKWTLQNQGEVLISKHQASAKNMKFTQGFQEISIESVAENGNVSNTLAVRLKDVDIGDIFPLFLKEPVIEGVANGNVYLRDIYTQLHADADIHLTQFRLNNDSIGVVDVGAKYNIDGKIVYNIKANDENFVMNADGYYNIKDSAGSPLQTDIKLDHAKIGILNTFLGSLFDNITGLATGNLTLKGNFQNLHLTGKAHLDSGALTVKFTKVRYTIPSADFVMTDDAINFGNFQVKDKFGNTGNIKGILYETAFENNRYDIDMSTDKLLLFDTKAQDNERFYGTVIGKANLSLKGPEENMQMTVSGEPVEASHIYIPTDNSNKSSQADYIIFKQYGTAAVTDTGLNTSNLNINLDITANNNATVSVILDELTGDIIEATGNGRLQIKIPAQGDVTMNGRYNIEQGNYNFNFQSLVKKPFELLPEQNSYIEWKGNPFDAAIRITARYTATNVALGDLIANTGSNLVFNPSTSGYRGDVYVLADLSGKLTKPNINFRLDFPQGSPVKTDDRLSALMAKIESDENEMLKQVTWLIVFDAFSPYGQLAGNNAFVQSAGINTISQKIASEVNRVVSNLLYKITGDKSLQLDFGTKTYSSASLLGSTSGSTLDRQSVELKVNKSLLNNKVIVTVGGDLDFNVSNATAASSNNLQWLPDISVQIILSKDKKLRAIIFNRSGLGVYGGSSTQSASIGRATKQGVSISYTRDFEKMFGKDNTNVYFTVPKNTDSLSGKPNRDKQE